MYKWILSIFIPLVFISATHENPDSLIQALKRANTQVERIDALNHLSFFQIKYSFDKSIAYGTEALNLSQGVSYKRGEGLAYLNLGWVHWINASYEQSIHYLMLAKQIFDVLEDTYNQARTNEIIGLLYYYGASEKSLKYLELSRDQFETIHDSTNLSIVLTELSFAYNLFGDVDEANRAAVRAHMVKLTGETLQAFYHTWMSSGHNGQAYQNEELINSIIPKTREVFEQKRNNNDPYGMALAGSELGNLFQIIANYDSALWYHNQSLSIYESMDERLRVGCELMDIGQCYQFMDQLQKADEAYEQGFQLLLIEKNYPGVSVLLDGRGKIALNQGKFEEALTYFNAALIQADTLGHPVDVIRMLRRLSDTYRSMGSYTEAINAAEESYEKAVKLGAKNHIMWGAEKIYLASKSAGDQGAALSSFEIYNGLAVQRERDLLSKENLQFQAIYELKEKAQMIEALNLENNNKQGQINLQQTYLIWAISAVLIVLVFVLVLTSRVSKIRGLNKRVSSQNTSLETMNREKEVLLKEIHHRVKNNLQMISSLLGMQKRRVEEPSTKLLFSYTQSRIKSMGLIHEHLYKSDTLSTIFLKSYIEDLVDSVLDSFYAESKPITTIVIPEYEVDIDTAISLGLMVNELVTNAVKYAFVDNCKPELEISIKEVAGLLKLIVKDNGPGGVIAHTGFGWTIINSMIENLSGSAEVKNKDGLEVTISLKDYKISA